MPGSMPLLMALMTTLVMWTPTTGSHEYPLSIKSHSGGFEGSVTFPVKPGTKVVSIHAESAQSRPEYLKVDMVNGQLIKGPQDIDTSMKDVVRHNVSTEIYSLTNESDKVFIQFELVGTSLLGVDREGYVIVVKNETEPTIGDVNLYVVMVRASDQEVLSNPVPFRVTVISETDVVAEEYAHGAAITAGVLVIAIVLFAFTIPAVVRCKRHMARAKKEKQTKIDEENIKKELEIEQHAYTNQALIHDDETSHASRVKVSEAKWDEKLRNGGFDTKNLNMSWLNLHCSQDDDSGTGMEVESLKSTSSSEKSPERKCFVAKRNILTLAVPSAMPQVGSAPCLLSQDSPKGILKKSAPKAHVKRSCHHSRHRQIQSQDSLCSSDSSQSGSQRTRASVSSAKCECDKKNDDASSNANKNTTITLSHEHVTIVVSDASDDEAESAKHCK